jgi:hypothetical protein
MTALAEVVVEAFPVLVIEVPKPLYHLQSKTSMQAASLKMGGGVQWSFLFSSPAMETHIYLLHHQTVFGELLPWAITHSPSTLLDSKIGISGV